MSSLQFPVFDADHHLYETEESFTRYLPAELKGSFRYVQVDGRTKVVVRGFLSDYIPNPTFEVVARPGAWADYFAGNNPEGKSVREMMGEPMRSIPAFRNPADRLAQLDAQGLDAALMFPTLASLIEVNFLDLPRETTQLLRAFNRWLLDEWTYDYQGRIFPTPVLNPTLPDEAVKELDFLLEHGARAALVRPGPVAGSPRTRSPFLPEFDPFWARVQESGIVIALHSSDSGYQKYVNDWEGSDLEYSAFKPSPFQVASSGSRPIMDTVYSAICHGMLSRFPGVKLLSVENGATWVEQALLTLDATYKKMPRDFAEHPRDVFLRNFHVSPFWEDDIDALVALIGADRICFGSDWPHPEGLAEPLDYVDKLASRQQDEVEKIMGGNMYGLLGLQVGAGV